MCYANMMQRIAWQRNCDEILNEDQVELSLATMGIESWCLLLVLCLVSFVIVALDL